MQNDAPNDAPPLCDCHGEKMLWQKDARIRAGGYWKCRVRHYGWRKRNPKKVGASYREWSTRNAEKRREYNRQWTERNRERIAACRRKNYDPEKSWRYYISRRRPRDLLAQRAAVIEKLTRLEE